MKPSKKEALKGYLCILPALVILGVFQIYPIFKAMVMSFYTKYNYMKDEVYAVGLGNFSDILKDPDFWTALKNTSLFVLGVVPATLIISLFIAVLLNRKIKFKGIFQSIYFIPFITSSVAVASVWKWIFDSKFGLLNYILSFFRIDPIKWLIDPKWAMASLIIFSIWKNLGYNIIILLAGLSNIDGTYYRAAKVDGASRWHILTKVTIPLLMPTLTYVSIMSLIGSFKVFDEVYILFERGAGPAKSCLTLVFYIYDKFATKYAYGIASAATMVLFAIVLAITLLQLRLSKKYSAS
ncbi:MAG: sugar ABC transporter permease [Lachnospiraceae bacterium]|jgi:multiple sugar transport system permease protein|nr:sugar ABC transporter permease [Lachnospiraceae bacterium]